MSVPGIEVLDIDSRFEALKTDANVMAVNAGKALNVYAEVAPEGVVGFYAVYNLIDAPDTYSIGGEHNFSSPVYDIKICGTNCGYVALRPFAAAVDAWLTDVARRGVIVPTATYAGRFIRTNVGRGLDIAKDTRIFWVSMTYKAAAWPSGN